MSNNWKRIRKAYEDHQNLHTRDYINIPIIHWHSAYSICEGADKSRFRTYKNFQIYLANHWGLLDTTNNINNNFEKLRNKISAYRNNVIKENQRNLYRDIEQLLEIVAFERELTLTVENIVLLILNVAVSTENFIVEGLIEKAYKFVYKSLVEDENYLRFDSTKNPLISYLAISIKRKNKNKLLSIS